MKPHSDNVVESPGDLTADWLTAAMDNGTVADFGVERIGTGQMSECYRVQLTYADGEPGSDRPDSVVLKVAATDPMSRQTGSSLGLYEREVCFYRDIAPGLHGPVDAGLHPGSEDVAQLLRIRAASDRFFQGDQAALDRRDLVRQHRHHGGEQRVEEQLGDTPSDEDDRDAGCQRDNEDTDGTARQTGDHPWPPHPQPRRGAVAHPAEERITDHGHQGADPRDKRQAARCLFDPN